MRVVDYKTGRSPSELFEGKALFQMKFYALVLWRMRGEVPTMLQLVYLGNGEVVRYSPDEARPARHRAQPQGALDRDRARGARPATGAANRRSCATGATTAQFCPAWGGTPPPLPERASLLALDPEETGRVDPADE